VNPDSKSSGYASCFDATNGKYLGSRTARTETLVSPDGRFHAYAESEAAGSEVEVGFPTCTNTSRLFVAGPDNQFRVVLAVEPVPDRHGNSIALVDWSPVGHRLLVAEGIWEWASEVGETDVRTYDADTGVVSTKKILADAFSKHFARLCAAVFEAQGFSADSKVIVIAKPWFDFGEEAPSKSSCSDKAGTWSIDFASGAIKRAEDNYKVVHRAKALAVPPVS
jgi:hypothetical protein